MIKTLATTALLAGLLLGTGCTAHTSTLAAGSNPDDVYANTLKAHNIHITSTEKARNYALAVCAALQRGQDLDLVVTEAMQGNPQDSVADTRFAIGTAQQVYCPGAAK